MAIDPFITGGLGAASLITGKNANKKANKEASKARRDQKALIDRQVGLFDLLQNIVKEADARGQFNPETQLRELEQRTADYESRDAGNLAGAMKVAGYRPGDSEIGRRLDAVKINYRKMFREEATNLKRGLFGDKLAAYGSIDPGRLNTAIGYNAGRESSAMGRMQNPAGLFQSLIPMLDFDKKK